MFARLWNSFFKNTSSVKTDGSSKTAHEEILDNIEIHFVENANEIVKKAFISKIHPYKDNTKKNIDIPSKTITEEKSPLPH